jgi:hypothetical membrane protein
MQRLRNLRSISNSISAANLKRKSRNSIAAIQETFHSTKDTFERHRIVFTVGTSIASVATAFIGLFQFPHHQHNLISLLLIIFIYLFFKILGYSLRHLHETRVDERLQSIERAVCIYLFIILFAVFGFI